MPRRRLRTRKAVSAAVLAVTMGALAACGGQDPAASSKQLTWYINPDGAVSEEGKANQAILAQRCSEASNGEYSIEVQTLPREATDQRQQLLRRLAAGDPGTDLMSIDPVFVAEFAEAGFLDPVPEADKAQLTEDAVNSILGPATWKGQLVGAPMWANTQVLWYRKSVAQKAGLDMSQPVTWDQVIDAAKATNTTVGVQARRYEGYSVWINALIESGGGHIVTNPGAVGADVQLGLDTEAGQNAARIIQKVAQEGVGGPALSSSNEETALEQFASPASSGFLLNWPYVWAALAERQVPFQDDIAWARYPQATQGQESRPPLGGIILGVNAASDNKAGAWSAIKCITSQENQVQYMLGTGNPAARKKVFDDPRVVQQFPMAALIRESLDAGAARPVTQYYGDISTALQRVFSPPEAVTPERTPQEATELIQNVLKGEALL